LHRELRKDYPQSLSLRTHRALSWLNRAEQETGDDDARFIFLWISLNAAYANDIPERLHFSETRMFFHFLAHLLENDREQQLYHIIWEEFPKAIRLLLDNPFVYQPFWDYTNGKLSETEWKEKFRLSKASAHRALGKMDTRKVLMVIFGRLYVLRNQLFHGSATWNGSKNREQVRHATAILSKLVPTIIHIMLHSGDQHWGAPRYPVIDRSALA